jgi:hypothetical protein
MGWQAWEKERLHRKQPGLLLPTFSDILPLHELH